MKISRTTFRIINIIMPGFIALLYLMFYSGVGIMSYLGLMIGFHTISATKTTDLVNDPIFGAWATLYGAAIIVVALIESSEIFCQLRIDESKKFGPGEESIELFSSKKSVESHAGEERLL